MSTAASKHANPPTWERILTILAFPVVGLALGVPWWIHTTSIERRSLGAVERLYRVGQEVRKVPVRVRGEGAERWVEWMGRCGGESAWELVPFEEGSIDPVIELTDGDAAPYLANGTLVFPLHLDALHDLPVSSTSNPSSRECTIIRASTAEQTLHQLIPLQPRELPAHALKYAEEVRLSFVLLNEDASVGTGFTGWQVDQAVQAYIQPLINALAPFHKFTIESQILHHAPVKFSPELCDTDRRAWWSVTQAQAGVFVNTEQWTLDSGSTNNPVLRFLLFVPREDRRPLVLEDAADSSDDIPALSTFRIPQFGSVVIPAFPSENVSHKGFLATEHVRAAFRVFQSDLRELLGVPAVPASLGPNGGPSSGLNAWQVSALTRTQIKATTADARGTLVSISRLVARIQEMRVARDVVEDVEGAVKLLEEAYPRDRGRPLPLAEVWDRTKRATALADRAFFNPNMVGLLYFPDEHKYAVYAPLFAPISVPVLVALLKEIKRWRRKRKARAEAGVGNGVAVREVGT